MRTVGISVRENVLALFSVLTTLFNSLEFGHIVNLGLLTRRELGKFYDAGICTSRLRKSGFFLQTSASGR